ncbi:hypothetical protein FEF65_07710 [Mariprofundus erugo]|uniref:PDZ domain-containing protein n=2 Tax=Mariprofundus erugo TaxID=2528639 RepID=A0A5R9GQI8_9PROT|nr:hypothetical protein FEF65_07710 [Mariprofundus erugo]
MAQMQNYVGRLTMPTELVLVVIMAWMVAGWLMPAPQPEQILQSQAQQPVAVALPDMAAMMAIPLFGTPVVKKEMAKPVAVSAPVVRSPLQISLLGTVVAGDASAAIVRLGSGGEKAFVIGSVIQPGVVLKQVEATSIVIDHSGRMEQISMPRSALPSQFVASEGAPAKQENRLMSRAQLQQQMQDLPTLLTQARLAPAAGNGPMGGFVISDIVPGSLFQLAGLQNGDVLHKVNGQLLDNPSQAMQLYQSLQNTPSIDVELTRAGQLQRVHYDIR